MLFDTNAVASRFNLKEEWRMLSQTFLTYLIVFSLVFQGVPLKANNSNEPAQPTKVKVNFEANTTGLAEHEAAAVRSIAEAVGQSLYYYAEFPIRLPQTIFSEGTQIIQVQDLYKAPTSNELSRLGGDSVSLSEENLESLRKQGLVIVPSVDYPGMYHVWKVSAWLQKGSENIEMSLRKDIADGYWHLTVGVGERVMGSDRVLDMATGVSNVFGALKDVLGLLVGVAERVPKYSEYSIQQMIAAEKQKRAVEVVEKDLPQDPYLKLFDEKVSEKLADILVDLEAQLEKEFSENRDIFSNELRSKNPGITDQQVEDLLMEKKNIKFLSLVQRHRNSIEAISTGLTQALIDHANTIQITFRGEQELADEIQRAFSNFESEFKTQNPLAGSLDEVFSEGTINEGSAESRQKAGRDRLGQILSALFRPELVKLQDAGYARIAQDLRNAGLNIQAQMLEANYQMIRKDSEKELSEAEKLRKQLEQFKEPAREFSYNRRIWLAQNWEISTASYPNQDGRDRVEYYSNQYKSRTVNSNYPFWRWWAAYAQAEANFKNGMYWLTVSNLVEGPIGLKSLFGNRPFGADFDVDRRTGEFVPKETVNTMAQRYRNFYNWIAERRQNFESESDSGLSKNFRRPFHIAWNSGVIGTVGTLSIAPAQISATALNTVFVGAAAATSLIWAPLSGMFMLGFDALIYDTKRSGHRFRLNRFFPIVSTILVKFSVKGILQTGAGLLGTVYHATVGLGRLGAGYGRKIVRSGYDAITRKLVLRPFGNVPYRDNRVFTRISGPGLSSEFYFQLRPEISVLGLQATLERDMLAEYTNRTREEIQAPVRKYNEFLRNVFGQFIKNSGFQKDVIAEIDAAVSEQLKSLDQQVSEREKFYQEIRGNGQSTKSLIRQSQADLERTLALGEALVKDFYEQNILKNASEEVIAKFWADRRLAPNDWQELTRRKLAITFSEGFLTPLQESDTTFRVVVENSVLRDIFDVLEGRYSDVKTSPVVVRQPQTSERSRVANVVGRALLPQPTLVSQCMRYFGR